MKKTNQSSKQHTPPGFWRSYILGWINLILDSTALLMIAFSILNLIRKGLDFPPGWFLWTSISIVLALVAHYISKPYIEFGGAGGPLWKEDYADRLKEKAFREKLALRERAARRREVVKRMADKRNSERPPP